MGDSLRSKNLIHVIMEIESHGLTSDPKTTLWHFRLFQTNPSQETKSRELDGVNTKSKERIGNQALH